MTLEMYSIKDELNGFTPPIPMVNDSVARRYLKDQMMGNPTMKNSPKDFSIWHMGQFDTEEGTWLTMPFPELVERGENFGDIQS